jgi:type VI secretion system protein ImpA
MTLTAAALLDPDRLLSPVAGPDPAGLSLRYSRDYDRIKEARRQDDPNLPQGVWKADPKRADWDLVIRLGGELIEKQTKDLQVACWLAEALVQRHGFGGLQPAFELLLGLCRNFWEHLHPKIEDGDIGMRIAPLEWLNAKLPAIILQIPVTRSGLQEIEAYSLTEYRNAQRLVSVKPRDAKKSSTGPEPILLADFEASARATPVAFHRELRGQVACGLHLVEELMAVLEEACGPQGPSLVAVREALTDTLGWIDTSLRSKGEEPVMVEVPAVEAALPGDTAEAGADAEFGYLYQGHAGPIQSREEAYYRLAEAAEFLFRTEPHSPVPYLIQRAVSWGSMPLHELLLELSRGRNDLAAIYDLLGFSGPEQGQKNGR